MKIYRYTAVRVSDGETKYIDIPAKSEKAAEKEFYKRFGQFWMIANFPTVVNK